ncbi:MAG: LysR family transcriptional regulator [Cupriavidus sp.]|uniref:LysR family transcriptional regulator n=1 Tax=Cupriavidus pauculus TaxID=82633 RepID=UPI000C3B021A|nr:LysR family transcriptional regulator [Cupriavidus pauculus]KAB0605317.1 LysR family transcriptional regulator [Cupriavidus pauculus]MBU66801.1 LysR family transcriptional regulator [Cupriavidus sp.]MCM3605228.1 LysR family transcriptional regulator [Cupriavidus pauculus]UAK99681.1 LysR family transcriptional regulator [Cupriavidus pauculus]
MNLKQLETVALVAELGSLSRAARAMGTAQSLVSRAIAQIESEWGDRLFERTGRGVVLSEFGKRVLPEIELLLVQSARLHDEVRNAAGVPTGIVRIGVLPSMTRRLIPALFEDLTITAPGVRLRVSEGFSGQLDEQLDSGHLDLAVINRYGPSPRQNEDVLANVTTYLIGKPDHPLASRRTVDFRQLDGVPLVLPPAPNGLRSILDQHARQQGVTLDVALEVESLNTMKEVALSGHALTILPELAVDREIGTGQLAAAEIVEPRLTRSISLALTQHHPLSRAARLVLSRLHGLVPRVASGDWPRSQ